jgi:hypothetical protein
MAVLQVCFIVRRTSYNDPLPNTQQFHDRIMISACEGTLCLPPDPTPEGQIRATCEQYLKLPSATSRRIFDATADALSEPAQMSHVLRCFGAGIKHNLDLSRSWQPMVIPRDIDPRTRS